MFVNFVKIKSVIECINYMFGTVISPLNIWISAWKKDSKSMLLYTFSLNKKTAFATHNNYTRQRGRKQEGARGYPTIYEVTHGTHGTFVCTRGTSRHLDAKAKAVLERPSVRARARARAHIAQGLLMSASQSGNFSTSRRVMHEPRGASRLYCPINQNEPGMATAALSAALRSESLFPATVEAAPVWKSSAVIRVPWLSRTRSTEKRGDVHNFEGTPNLHIGIIKAHLQRQIFRVVTFIMSSATRKERFCWK